MDTVSMLYGHKAGAKAARDGVLIGITAQPEDVTVQAGKRAYFTVAALGENLTYQWQYSADGETWANSGYSSATKATLPFLSNASYDGYLYRCVVTSDGGTVTSRAATLTIESEEEGE